MRTITETERFKLLCQDSPIYEINIKINDVDNVDEITNLSNQLREEWLSIAPDSTIRVLALEYIPTYTPERIVEELIIDFKTHELNSPYKFRKEEPEQWNKAFYTIIRGISLKNKNPAHNPARVVASIRSKETAKSIAESTISLIDKTNTTRLVKMHVTKEGQITTREKIANKKPGRKSLAISFL